MTREEEIIQAADECYPTWEEYNAGFYQGAKWADQHSRKGLWNAEKVIEWLMNNINNYLVKGRDIDLIYEDLRKAMEE